MYMPSCSLGVHGAILLVSPGTTKTLRRRTMFKSGDLGWWLEDGGLGNLGRRDDQVNIKGFRVKPEGISVAIERLGIITKARPLLLGCSSI